MTTSVAPITVGLLADTHCVDDNGLDLPAPVTEALGGCQIIVHLGDLTTTGVLDRLADLGAEVIALRNDRLDPPATADARLMEGVVERELNGHRIAFVREHPHAGITDAEVIVFGVPAGGGGHDHRVALDGRTLIVTPGSPTYPLRHPTIARLTITEHVDVEIIHLPT